MKWSDRFRIHERMEKLEQRTAVMEEKIGTWEERFSRLLWQVRSVVRSVVKQYSGKSDD